MYPDAEDIQPEQWTITDEAGANWLLRKLANLQAEADRVAAQALAICEDLHRERERLKGRYMADLEKWARENLPKGKRSIKLLQGTVSFRAVGASLKVADPALAASYAEAMCGPSFFSPPTLNTTLYRQKAEHDLRVHGELLPGIEIVPGRESVSLKFGKD